MDPLSSILRGCTVLRNCQIHRGHRLQDQAFLKSASLGGKENSEEIEWVMYLKEEFGKISWILMEIRNSQQQET